MNETLMENGGDDIESHWSNPNIGREEQLEDVLKIDLNDCASHSTLKQAQKSKYIPIII